MHSLILVLLYVLDQNPIKTRSYREIKGFKILIFVDFFFLKKVHFTFAWTMLSSFYPRDLWTKKVNFVKKINK